MKPKKKRKMTRKQMLKRMEKLYKEAEDNFINTEEFTVVDWLDTVKALEYERLQFALGETDYNPDEDLPF